MLERWIMNLFKRKLLSLARKLNLLQKINCNKFIFYFLFGLKNKYGQFKININTNCLVLSQYPGAETKGLGGLIAQYPKNFEVLCFTNGSTMIPELDPVTCASVKKQLAYYEKITKAHGIEKKDTENASRLDLRNWIMEIIESGDL